MRQPFARCVTNITDSENIQYAHWVHDKYFKESISKPHLHHEDTYMMHHANELKDVHDMRYTDESNEEQYMPAGKSQSPMSQKMPISKSCWIR